MTQKIKVGIIGGSGLDDPQIFQNRQEKYVDTPFGKPADALIVGVMNGVDCVLLARHGRKHHLYPSNVNYRANIWALKQEGCTHIIVTTACGSLKADVNPGDFVILEQFIDRTTQRKQTFYDGTSAEHVGVCHVPMRNPFCEQTSKVLALACDSLHVKYRRGTVVTIEGPRFSSLAESHLFQQWGADVINMTTCPEAALAKEAGLLYAAVALVTDYDCWHPSTAAVSVDMVLKVMKENASKAVSLITAAVSLLANQDWSAAIEESKMALEHSIM